MLNKALTYLRYRSKAAVVGCSIIILAGNLNLQAQDKSLVQIKAFDQQLKPMANLSVSINGKEFIPIDSKKATFHEVSNEDLPPKSIKVNIDELEAESWTYSKGTLEIIVRKKLYTIIEVRLKNADNRPLGNVTVNFKGKKNISATTNAQGTFQLPLALGEKIANVEQFNIPGYHITNILSLDKESTLIVVPNRPRRDTEKSSSASLTANPFSDFDLNQLDSIRSLTVFYAVFKNYDLTSLDDSVKQRIDAKFYQLVGQLQESEKQNGFISKISDSSFVKNDVENLLAQAKFENTLLDNFRNDFDKKIEIINQKVAGGTINLNASERDKLLQDLNTLENVLQQNENKFYKNISYYRVILASLKSSFSNIQNLENKLEESEAKRMEEQKASRNKILVAGSISLVFGVLVIYLILLRMKLVKQQKSLIHANSEVKRINENLEGLVFERTRLLIDAYHEMDIFLYRASHDLRAPICTIIGLCNIVMHSKDEAHELVRKVSDTAFKMDGMLKKLRMISEINQPSNYSSIYLSQKIEQVTGLFSKFIKDHNIDVVIDCPEDLNFQTYPDLIEIILHNLIDNALFFSTVRKNHQPRIAIKASIDANNLSLTIHDNGIGIDEKIRIKLWDMFFVGHEYSKGNGLGLYIVFKSIQALNGKIDVQTETNAFTMFTINIPVNTIETSTLTRVRPQAVLAESA